MKKILNKSINENTQPQVEEAEGDKKLKSMVGMKESATKKTINKLIREELFKELMRK